jgi:hypothetical protein
VMCGCINGKNVLITYFPFTKDQTLPNKKTNKQ